MTKEEMLKLIDEHKNKLVNPVQMLHWTWLRVFINSIREDEYNLIMDRAIKILSR